MPLILQLALQPLPPIRQPHPPRRTPKPTTPTTAIPTRDPQILARPNLVGISDIVVASEILVGAVREA